MSFQLRRLLFLTIACSIPFANLDAQDNAFRTGQYVDRVIKLRSSEQSDPPAPPEIGLPDGSSRAARLASRPVVLQDPSQIKYDEIGARSVAQKQAVSARSSIQQPFVDRDMTPEAKAKNIERPKSTGLDSSAPSMPVVSTVTPQISTRILAPRFVNKGQPTTVRIQLKNTGQQAAQDVSLTAKLPPHAKFVSARPAPSYVEGQLYQFKIGKLGAHQLKEFLIELIPLEKRPMDVATQVQIMDQQQFSMSVRQPELQIDVSGPSRVNTGQWVSHVLTVTNIGDGIAESVRIVRNQPQAFHIDESQQGFFIRRIEPGESKKVELKSFAQAAGDFDLEFAISSNNLDSQKLTHAMTVLQPELQISAIGPKVNFVNRDGIYTIQLDNSGQVDVTQVRVALDVPQGFEVTTVNLKAKVEKQTGRLIWVFDKIPAMSTETIQLKAISKTPGRQVCTIDIQSNETRTEQIQLVTQIAARADVSINVTNQSGPVEVGGTTEFVVSVSNRGSIPATDVAIRIELASSLIPVAETSYVVDETENTIQFSGLEIAAGETKEYRIGAVGAVAGEHVVRSVVQLNGSERSLIAEGSVFVFEANQSRVSESLEPTIHHR